jgi:hypothetical protein
MMMAVACVARKEWGGAFFPTRNEFVGTASRGEEAQKRSLALGGVRREARNSGIRRNNNEIEMCVCVCGTSLRSGGGRLSPLLERGTVAFHGASPEALSRLGGGVAS